MVQWLLTLPMPSRVLVIGEIGDAPGQSLYALVCAAARTQSVGDAQPAAFPMPGLVSHAEFSIRWSQSFQNVRLCPVGGVSTSNASTIAESIVVLVMESLSLALLVKIDPVSIAQGDRTTGKKRGLRCELTSTRNTGVDGETITSASAKVSALLNTPVTLRFFSSGSPPYDLSQFTTRRQGEMAVFGADGARTT